MSKKIIEYKLVALGGEGNIFTQFEKMAQSQLDVGFQPLGGIDVTALSKSAILLVQVMVKYDD